MHEIIEIDNIQRDPVTESYQINTSTSLEKNEKEHFVNNEKSPQKDIPNQGQNDAEENLMNNSKELPLYTPEQLEAFDWEEIDYNLKIILEVVNQKPNFSVLDEYKKKV